MIAKTDKTGQMAAFSKEEYSKGGDEHTTKDKVITKGEAEEIQRILNGHSSMWAKMLNAGQDHGHETRVRGNLISQADTIPEMHTLIKDHKPLRDGVRTRPVVNGSGSMNTPLNNQVNGLIEQVARNSIG